MRLSPETVMKLIGYWPPYLGAGIKVLGFNKDFTEIKVRMRQRWHNTNYVGTHFGGNLYSMADPFFMFILMKHLAKDHIVWDKAANIDFVSPGKGDVFATFSISLEQIQAIREQAALERKVEPIFSVEIVDKHNTVIARVKKTLYVRQKKKEQ